MADPDTDKLGYARDKYGGIPPYKIKARTGDLWAVVDRGGSDWALLSKAAALRCAQRMNAGTERIVLPEED